MFSSVTIEKAGRSGARQLLASAAKRTMHGLAARANWCSSLLGLLLLAPALGTGLVADDYLQELMLRDNPGLPGLSHRPFDLFRLADGQAATASHLINEGVYPWWVDPEARLAFFRPLSSLSHVIDHLAWPGNARLMHLHSLLWFGLLLLIVAAIYHRFGASNGSFSLALLLFAVDDSHAPVVGWIANRNALISLCLALPALVAHDRFRRERFGHGLWLGPLCFGLGLLGGEVAICVLAYLVAYAAYIDRGPWLGRWGSLLPYLLVVVCWKLWCIRAGYGASGSGIYVDPASEPIRFAWAIAERLPALALGLLAIPFADFWELYPMIAPSLRVGVWLLGIAVLLAFARALASIWKQDAHVRFWVTGSALALIPLCATFPHDRMLLAPGIGAMAVIAVLLQRGWVGRGKNVSTLGVAALIAVHLVLAPVLAPIRVLAVDDFSALLWQTNQTLPVPAERTREDSTLLLINPPLDPLASYLPVYREAARQPRMGQQLWLSSGVSDLVITVLDEHRIALRPETGFLCNGLQQMLRDKARAFRLGDRVQLERANVEVTELTTDGRPLEVVMSFERPLRDPRLIWMRWLERGYVPFQLPATGESVVLPGANLYEILFTS